MSPSAARHPAQSRMFVWTSKLKARIQRALTETVIGCLILADPSSTTYALDPIPVEDAQASIAVYAWLGDIPKTDRAPNTDFYPVTSLSAVAPNLFYDPEPARVGGVTVPTNKPEILTPYLALAGLVVAASAVVVAKKRSDI